MKDLFLLLLLITAGTVQSQQSIDGTINFQTDPNKAYALYIPSTYDAQTPNPAFLALHPLNTRRWDASAWRDTLVGFAESNGLIIIAPDGGVDGRIDDAIDTAFTTFLLDSVERAYNIDSDEIYVVGFSWGARTTYTYGLSNTERFAGYIPLGAAITRLNEIGGVVANARDEAFYVIHGANDNPANRFTPAVNALRSNGACIKDTLIAGLGHTIDFADFHPMLTMGYEWLRSQCGTTSVDDNEEFFPEVPGLLTLNSWNSQLTDLGFSILQISDTTGRQIGVSNGISKAGIYLIHLEKNGQKAWKKVVLK